VTSATDTSRPATGLPIEKLFLSQTEACRLVGVSLATWYRLRREDLVPKPVMLGGYPKWRRADLDAWAAALPTADYRWRRAVAHA
jgi:predicted DNA-binding transcriptional regulator AlpA